MVKLENCEAKAVMNKKDGVVFLTPEQLAPVGEFEISCNLTEFN